MTLKRRKPRSMPNRSLPMCNFKNTVLHRQMMKKMGPATGVMKRQMMCPLMEQMRQEQPATKSRGNESR